jgi:hypothetical protein
MWTDLSVLLVVLVVLAIVSNEVFERRDHSR